MKKNLGKIKKIDLRQVFQNEASDFTPWLENNIDKLSEAIGVEIIDVRREGGVGNEHARRSSDERPGSFTGFPPRSARDSLVRHMRGRESNDGIQVLQGTLFVFDFRDRIDRSSAQHAKV